MVAAAVLCANIVVSIATDSSSLLRWLCVPVAGTIAAAASAIIASRRPPIESTPAWMELLRTEDRTLATTTKGRTPWGVTLRPTVATAVVAALVVLGIGGTVVSAAARYGMAWVTGNEHGPDRLVRTASTTTSGLTIAVTRFEQTAHFTRLNVEVINHAGAAISLPLGDGNAMLIAGDGTSRPAQPFQSDWTESVGVDATQQGVITFSGHLPTDSTRARLVFSTVFGSIDNPIDSFVISGIQLGPSG
jgi:hypothetical protein